MKFSKYFFIFFALFLSVRSVDHCKQFNLENNQNSVFKIVLDENLEAVEEILLLDEDLNVFAYNSHLIDSINSLNHYYYKTNLLNQSLTILLPSRASPNLFLI